MGQAQTALFVQMSPREVQQGRTSLLRVTANSDVTRMEVVFDGNQFPLYRSVDGDWIGFLPASMTAERGTTDVSILAWRENDSIPTTQVETLDIVWGSFFYQDIVIEGSLARLLDPALNQQEEDTLQRVYSRYTPEKLWTGGLLAPVPGPMISEFGGIRNYNNGVLESRHTGSDFRAGLGEPTMAAGNGRVVFVATLPIHGNHVVIDHGIGVLTGYSHLSEVYVVPGQRVLAGDVIGAVGSTGRTQGAHAHFEVVVNGVWVDPPQFMSLQIPDAVDGWQVGG
jgi:murein DD-endopeptidase MepM/ murein hydrolase activator NlpD